MDKLQLSHIAPYFPYYLKMRYQNDCNGYCRDGVLLKMKHLDDVPNSACFTLEEDENGDFSASGHISMFKPILRPLSNIFSFFNDSHLFDSDIDIRTFLNEDFLKSRGIETIDEIYELKAEWLPLGFINTLLKYHFDVFGLIEKGLAIDFTTIKEKER
jgi:hypothetical protein